MSSGIGKEFEKIDLLDLIPPDEGMVMQYYGRIGSGKTYSATCDALRDLKEGKIVYVNWDIKYDGFDDRESTFRILFNMLLGRNRFYVFPKDKLRKIVIDSDFIKNFSKITDAKVYLDEGHVAFDSYLQAKMSMTSRQSVLETRHFNRSISIISQRPTAIHVTLRANVNIFYKCEKMLGWPIILFRRTEFQDMVQETVDEEEPISTKYYIGIKSIFNSYDSRYLRHGLQDPNRVMLRVFDVNWWGKVRLLIGRVKSAILFVWGVYKKIWGFVKYLFKGTPRASP